MRAAPAFLFFDDMTEKLAALKRFNDMLRTCGLPAAHEGLSQTSVEFQIFMCISETPIERP